MKIIGMPSYIKQGSEIFTWVSAIMTALVVEVLYVHCDIASLINF